MWSSEVIYERIPIETIFVEVSNSNWSGIYAISPYGTPIGTNITVDWSDLTLVVGHGNRSGFDYNTGINYNFGVGYGFEPCCYGYGNWNEYAITLDLSNSNLGQGFYNIQVTVNTGYPAKSYKSQVKYFSISPKLPEITITSPQSIAYPTTSIDLNVSADEPVDTWIYSLNSGATVTFTPNTTITGVEGQNNIVVYANDTTGNIGSSMTYFTIDSVPPTITIDSPQNVTYQTTSIDLNVSADEAINTWTYSLDGANNVTFGSSGPERQLTTSSGDDYHAVWSPDGSKIAFLSDRAGGRELWVMNADGSGQTQLTNLGIVGTMAWSPDGTEIAFNHRRTAEADIYTISGDGSNLTQLTSTDSQYEEVRGYSPDGTKILYDKGSNGWFEVWIMNSDGSGQQSLATEHGQDTYPQWSPDGSKISYVYASDYNQPLSLAMMNPDGSAKTTVASFPMTYGFYYGWSPDSSKIAFGASASSSQSSIREVYIINADGTELTKLADGDLFMERHPGQSEVWSPDGNWIVYHSNDGGNWDISIMHPDGSEKTQLTTDPSTDKSAHFSPDGSKILFVSDRSGNNDIWVLELGGTGSNTTLEGLSDGVHSVTVYANDTAGNVNYSEVYFTISLDTTPPSITIDSPQNVTYTTASIDLNVSADEAINTWTYSLDSGSNVTFTPNTTFGSYSRWIDMTNTNATDAIPSNYTYSFSFNSSSIISAGKMRPNGTDLRVVCNGNSIEWRNLTGMNDAGIDTTIQFGGAYDLSIPAGNSNSGMCRLYYGNPGAKDHSCASLTFCDIGKIYKSPTTWEPYDNQTTGTNADGWELGHFDGGGGGTLPTIVEVPSATDKSSKAINPALSGVSHLNFPADESFYVEFDLLNNDSDGGFSYFGAGGNSASTYYASQPMSDCNDDGYYDYGYYISPCYNHTIPVKKDENWHHWKMYFDANIDEFALWYWNSTDFGTKVHSNGPTKFNLPNYDTVYRRPKNGASETYDYIDNFIIHNSPYIEGDPVLTLGEETEELTDGSHNVIVYAVDTAGNVNSSAIYFTVDLPPTVTIDSPQNSTYGPGVPITISYNADEAIAEPDYYQLDGGANTTFDNGITTITPALGSHSIVVWAKDAVGNWGSDVKSFSIIDTTPQPITTCTGISSPGVYELTTDIIDSSIPVCIIIISSDVIFDGQGHTIDGIDGIMSYGVYSTNSTLALTNVTVKNLKLTDWYYGIYYRNAQNGNISNNTVISNRDSGIRLESSSNNFIYDNLFNNTNNFNFGGTILGNDWNTTKTAGTNIIGGPYLGGNFWAKPDGTGFSETCVDSDSDGICDMSYTLASGNVDYLPLTILVDTTPPAYSNMAPRDNSYTTDTSQDISIVITDEGSGVNETSLSMSVSGSYYDLGSAKLTYNSSSGLLTYYSDPGEFTEGQVVSVVVHAEDNAESQIDVAWKFTVADTIYSIPVTPGWNMISIPLELYNWSITSVLASIEGNYTDIYAYVNGMWYWDTSLLPFFKLTDMAIEQGYWINVSSPDTLEFGGTVPSSTTISVSPGWNLVGYPSFATQNITTVLSPIGYTDVYTYKNGMWYWDTSLLPSFVLTEMTDGQGYWINSTAAGSYDVGE